MNDKCDFNNVPLGSNDKNSCSPFIENKYSFRGVIINAPDEIVIRNSGPYVDSIENILPVCGYYLMSLASLMKKGALNIVLENIATGEQIRGEVLEEDDSPEAPLPDDLSMPEIPAAVLESQYTGSYFNVNIPQYTKLPNETATYNLFVEIGDGKSNTLTLKVIGGTVSN